MKKTLYKRIFGILVIVCAFAIIMPERVYAVDEKKCEEYLEKAKSDGSFWEDKYGISVKYDGGNLVIKMRKKDMSQKLEKIEDEIKFKVSRITSYNLVGEKNKLKKEKVATITDPTEIESYITSNRKRITPGKSITIKPIDSSLGIIVRLKPDGFDDPQLEAKCGEESDFYIKIDFYRGNIQDLITDEGYIEKDIKAIKAALKDPLNCNLNWSEGSFEYKFCEDQKKAINYNKAHHKNTYQDPSNPKSFKCKITKPKDVHKISEGDDKYYQAPEYLRGVTEQVIQGGSYVNHYTCKTKKKPISCKIKCEEIVTVQYGPPQAAKGSICFEYQVQVTSRVNCGVSTPPPEPPKYKKYCTPLPICYSGSANYRQGGPDESFDDCVNKCDGGKYSDRCSNKCYKEVYGKDLTGVVNGSEISYVDKLNTTNTNAKLQNVDTDYGGEYKCSGKRISWSPSEDHSRWHDTNKWGLAGSNYTRTINGIPRSSHCTDVCKWLPGSCKMDGTDYMNPKVSLKDYNDNIKKYEDLVKKCSNYVKCNTHQSTFSISTKVAGGTDGKEDDPYYFPYSNNASNTKDILQFNSQGTSNNDNTTIVSHNGCYDFTDQSKYEGVWYQSAWSFSGTWKSYKGGAIAYKNPCGDNSNDCGYLKWDKQFCTKRSDAVNKNYWFYYYGYGNDNNSVVESNTSSNSEYVSKCLTDYTNYSNGSNSSKLPNFDNQTDVDKWIDAWNIKADTVDFGHLKWDINIKCFYAYYAGKSPSESSDGTSGDNAKNNKCITAQDNYRVRTIDLKDVFPSTNGEKITDTSKTGRQPGFNWSQYATNTTNKVGDYKSNPTKYVEEIQKLGYDVYNDNYLDYRIELTKANIKALQNETHNYGTYAGKNTVGESIFYESDFLRSSNKVKATVPDKAALKCNNLKNYKVAECEKYY